MGDFKTLSIDLGSTMGYCIGINGVIMDSGEVTLNSGAAGLTHPGHRLMRFHRWLSQHTDVNEILFEDVKFITSTAQIVLYGKLLGVLEQFSLAHGIRMGKPHAIPNQKRLYRCRQLQEGRYVRCSHTPWLEKWCCWYNELQQ